MYISHTHDFHLCYKQILCGVLSIESIHIIKKRNAKGRRKIKGKSSSYTIMKRWLCDCDGGKKQAEESFSFNEIVSILCKYRSRDLNKCWGAQKNHMNYHGTTQRIDYNTNCQGWWEQ